MGVHIQPSPMPCQASGAYGGMLQRVHRTRTVVALSGDKEHRLKGLSH